MPASYALRLSWIFLTVAGELRKYQYARGPCREAQQQSGLAPLEFVGIKKRNSM